MKNTVPEQLCEFSIYVISIIPRENEHQNRAESKVRRKYFLIVFFPTRYRDGEKKVYTFDLM